MALASGTTFNVQASATTGNTGGAGFNTANANFFPDLTAILGTTASPIVSSSSYNFTASDVGASVYIKSGSDWTPGFYPIASVAGNAATLSAGVGQATQLNAATGMYVPNTVAGVAGVSTPNTGTFGVNYAMKDSAITTATDFTSVGASTTLTSATAVFTSSMIGNLFHQTTTGTGAHGLANWFEIVSFTNATTVVLDRTPNDGTTSVACTGFVGGAGRFNGLEDAFLEMIPAASLVYMKGGAYTVSGAIAVASTNSTTTSPSNIIGYTTVWGDPCTGASRPTLNMAAASYTLGQAQNLWNTIVTGTANGVLNFGTSSTGINVKVTNTSTTATRPAIAPGSNGYLFACEAVSQNGNAFNTTGVTSPRFFGCYAHDSVVGINSAATLVMISYCLVEACSTEAMNLSGGSPNMQLLYNTVYGREAKMGNGFNISNATSPLNRLIGNIVYGFSVGITVNTEFDSNVSLYNDFFNNTTDCTNFKKGPFDLALNPQFTQATQITGSTASGSGSVLTDTNADFSTVEDNVDYVRVLSGTGATVACFLITAHTSTTLTCNNTVGTNATADRVYFIPTGHNFAIGTNLKAAGFPGAFVSGSPSGQTIGYLDTGAVQRQESGGGAGASSYTFS